MQRTGCLPRRAGQPCTDLLCAGGSATKRLAARLLARFCQGSQARAQRAVELLLDLASHCTGCARGSTAEATLCDVLLGLGQLCPAIGAGGLARQAAQALIRLGPVCGRT